MRTPFHTLCCILSFAVLFAVSCRLSSDWEEKLAIYPEGMDILRAQSSEDGEEAGEEEDIPEDTPKREKRTESGTAQKTWLDRTAMHARYDFVNFNKDRLTVSYSMPSGEYLNYLAGYGYSDAELARLRRARDAKRKAAWEKTVVKQGRAAAEKAVEAVDLDYETDLRKLMRSRGLALRAGNVVECEMPVIVRRNIPVVKPLALAFQGIAKERGYGSDELIGAVLAMVQTAMRYKIPPPLEGQLHTGGLLPPARALLSGWGDCDTKTGTAASILGNWSGIRMVGIAVPGHYLMAVRRIPGKGDMFVKHDGVEYVLVEPAGPAWLEPGQVGRHTAELLKGAEGYKVEPFFSN